MSAARKERDRGDERQKRTDERRYVESVALSQCALGEMTGRSRRREHRGQFVREVKRWKLTELLVGIFLLLARRGAARLNFELRLNVGQKVKVYGT